ncbi:MAG: nucleotidyltransferase domain-containing protein [Chloroflexota bacterium]
MNLIQKLVKKQLISPPKWLPNNVHYLVMMGSIAYGASNDSSDMDVYGFCIPPKSTVFPHLAGEIPGFGTQKKRFEQWQEHHIFDAEEKGGQGREYDLSIYSIVKYFNLVMQNNPNMVDSLFVPPHCVLYQTQIGQLVRENRQLFLHKGAWHKYKGYAYSQLNKMQNKKSEGKRRDLVKQYGYDVKFAYHLVRLLLEVEEILETGNLTTV